jgi:hypothetical protein
MLARNSDLWRLAASSMGLGIADDRWGGVRPWLCRQGSTTTGSRSVANDTTTFVPNAPKRPRASATSALLATPWSIWFSTGHFPVWRKARLTSGRLRRPRDELPPAADADAREGIVGRPACRLTVRATGIRRIRSGMHAVTCAAAGDCAKDDQCHDESLHGSPPWAHEPQSSRTPRVAQANPDTRPPASILPQSPHS